MIPTNGKAEKYVVLVVPVGPVAELAMKSAY
jgi:hypothetical protein